jgi:hypothetical protein
MTTSRTILAAALATLAMTGAARADTLGDLAAELQKACRPAPPGMSIQAAGPGDHGLVEIGKIRTPLLKVFAFDAEFVLDETAASLADKAIKQTVPAEKVNGKLFRLGRLATQWTRPGTSTAMLPLERGGLRILDRTGAPTDAAAAALQEILAGKGDDFIFVCRGPIPEIAEAEDDGASPTASFVLSKTAPDLAESKLSKKAFGEFTFSDDRDARAQAYGIAFAAGVKSRTIPVIDEGPWRLNSDYTLYGEIERSGSNDPTADNYVNNLNFGAQVSGRFRIPKGPTWFGYYALSLQGETDDDFAARAYRAQLMLDPPIPLIGRRTPARVFGWLGGEVDGGWSLKGVADWVQVDDPGEKKKLVDQAEYVRLGYDVGLKFRIVPEEAEWRLVWSTLYKVRDGRTEDGGDAQMFTSGVMFEPSDTSHHSFGLSYERGENLQSFEKSEIWKLNLGLRY